MGWFDVVKKLIYNIKYDLYMAGLPESLSRFIIRYELFTNIDRHTIIKALVTSKSLDSLKELGKNIGRI